MEQMKPFKLTLKEDYINYSKPVLSQKYSFGNKFLSLIRYIGFYTIFSSKVITEPKKVVDGYEYEIKLIDVRYYAFWIKVWTRKL